VVPTAYTLLARRRGPDAATRAAATPLPQAAE
jgi:hypothetical protein